MAPPRQVLARTVVGYAPTMLTFAALAAVLVWGMRTGWTLSGSGGSSRSAEEPEKSRSAVQVTLVDEAPAGDPAAPSVRARLEFPSAEEVERAGLKLEEARTQSLARYVTAEGSVGYDPDAYSQLPARAAGILFWAEKYVGQPVRKGEALALVEAAEVGRAKADFLASLTRQELQARNLEGLRASGVGSERALREAEAAVTEARLKLVSDQQALLNLGLAASTEELRPLTPEQRVERVQFLGIPPELLPRVTEQTRSANLLPLVCPFDGTVVKRTVALGESVTPGRPLFIVAGLRRLHLELAVEPRDMAEVHLGQTALFSPEGAGGYEARGTVVHINPEVDEQTRRVWVHAEAPNPEGKLRPNSFGRGRIRVAEQPDAVVVPEAALQRQGDDYLVFVRVGETAFEARRARPGLRGEGVVAVAAVRPGERVVTTGSHDLLTELRRDELDSGE